MPQMPDAPARGRAIFLTQACNKATSVTLEDKSKDSNKLAKHSSRVLGESLASVAFLSRLQGGIIVCLERENKSLGIRIEKLIIFHYRLGCAYPFPRIIKRSVARRIAGAIRYLKFFLLSRLISDKFN